ncbi:MAG: nucleotide exchange factor GrpE [bacterium]
MENWDDRISRLEEKTTSSEEQGEAIPDSKEARIEKVEQCQRGLEDRLNELETKFDEVCSHLKQMGSPSPPVKADPADEEIVLKEPDLDIQGLITQAKAKEQESLKEDRESIELGLKNAGFWLDRGERLKALIKELANPVDEAIANSNRILVRLPEELKTNLESSQQGLNIIGRMLQGLVEQDDRLKRLVERIELADNVRELEDDEWRELLHGETDERSAQEKINEKLDAIGRSNYRLVSKAGELAEKKQKIWLDFIVKQILPIFDGINDGKKHTSILIDELMERFQESESELREWFDTYATLSRMISTVLNDVGVYRMDVEPGMMIDFERHEPSLVEADSEMENEQIKEIGRDGYEYVNQNGNRQTLRLARVVVVKNND